MVTQRSSLRGVMTAVIVMGVLIVAGVAVLMVTIVRRLSTPPVLAARNLDEPAGTHLAQIAPAGDRLAVLLTGGGPDRIVLLDPRTGLVTGHIGLAQ